MDVKKKCCGDGDKELLEEKGNYGYNDGERAFKFPQVRTWLFMVPRTRKSNLEKMGKTNKEK